MQKPALNTVWRWRQNRERIPFRRLFNKGFSLPILLPLMLLFHICMNNRATEPCSYCILIPLQIVCIYRNYVLLLKG